MQTKISNGIQAVLAQPVKDIHSKSTEPTLVDNDKVPRSATIDLILTMRDLLRRASHLLDALEPLNADALVQIEMLKDQIKEALK